MRSDHLSKHIKTHGGGKGGVENAASSSIAEANGSQLVSVAINSQAFGGSSSDADVLAAGMEDDDPDNDLEDGDDEDSDSESGSEISDSEIAPLLK